MSIKSILHESYADCQKYDQIYEILKDRSSGEVSSLDFYRELFPSGYLGSDLDSGVKGESYAIFGIYPDKVLYHSMKRLLDIKNGFIKDTGIKYAIDVLNEKEIERMLKYYLAGAHTGKHLQNKYIDRDLLSQLTEEEVTKEVETLDVCGFELTPVTTFKYPDPPVLPATASASEKRRAQNRHMYACAMAEYDYDKRYAKLDAQFNARCFRQTHQVSSTQYISMPIMADWMYYQRVDNSLRQIGLCIGQQAALMAPFDYFGRKRCRKNIGNMYALALDIDGITVHGLLRFFEMDFFGLPRPTYIVLSGTGLHFYYFLDNPMPVPESFRKKIEQLKLLIASVFVNSKFSTRLKPDKQPWDEEFRVIGSMSKLPDRAVRAFRVGDRINFEELVQYVHEQTPNDGLGTVDTWQIISASGMTREEWKAKQEYLRSQRKSNDYKPAFPVGGRGFYDSWIKKIMTTDALHSRFHRTCILFADAAYCGIPYDEVLKFATTELYQFYNSYWVSQGDRFLMSDIMAASKYYDRSASSYKLFTLEKIEDLTHIRLERTKRNGLKQDVHCKRMIRNREADIADGLIKNTHFGAEDGNKPGRSTAEQTIRAYLQEHPDSSKADVIRGTGLTKPTVYKWWKVIHEEVK